LDKYLDKEHIKICGQAVEDFVNSETTDTACLSLIPKTKKVFDFSIDFEKKAKESFPYLNNILDSLNDKQRVFVESYFDVWTFDNFVDDYITSLGTKAHFNKIDKGSKIFQTLRKEIHDLKYNRDYNSKKFDEIIIIIKKAQPKLKNTHFDWKNYIGEFCEQLITRKKTNILYRKYSKNISERAKENIKKVLNNEAFTTHHDIYHSQQIFKIIINRLVNDISLNEYAPFEDIIARYDSNFSAQLVYDNNYKLKYEHLSMSENDFLQSPPDHLKKHSYEKFKNILEKQWEQKIYSSEENVESIHNRFKGNCLDSYKVASYYFFVEFLKKDGNARLFHLCEKCGKYFVAKKVDKRIKYCPLCSPKSKMGKEERKEYQKKYREKKRKEKITHERESKISNYMEKLSCTREDAEEIIEADSNL